MIRQTLVGGALAALVGVALLVPATVERLDRGVLSGIGIVVVSLGVVLILGGAALTRIGFRRRNDASMPAPVRAAIIGNLFFVAFLALEFSDGLVRQGGRVFYWTSVLFLPALLLFYGLVTARRWAWWTARGVTAIHTLWFVVFIVVIPFADIRSGGVSVPWWGRVYMVGVTLLLASTVVCAFHALGLPTARSYFGRSGNT